MIFTPGDIVYSSSALIELAPPNIGVEKLMVLMEAEGVTFKDLRDALGKLKGLRAHVVGDTIVDSYTYTAMIGGMTKTPTMSVRFERKIDYVGGAGVVAKHLRAAGAEVTFSTVLGNDAYKSFVLDDLNTFGVHCLPIIDETRPTTNKNAIVADGYRLLKVDTLDNRSISDKIVEQLRRQIADTKADAVVFSDFRHGIFNRGTIPQLISAIPDGTFRVADSQVASRWGNILEFEGFDLITPNEREARFALGDQDSVVRPLALELAQALEVQDADPQAAAIAASSPIGQTRRSTTAHSSPSRASPTGWSMRSAPATRFSPTPRSPSWRPRTMSSRRSSATWLRASSASTTATSRSRPTRC